jgi:hypothetical protein
MVQYEVANDALLCMIKTRDNAQLKLLHQVRHIERFAMMLSSMLLVALH